MAINESDDDTDATDPDIDELSAADAADLDLQDAVDGCTWLKAALAVIQARTAEPDPEPRIQYAFDRMAIAAAERITRILHSDLAPDLR